MKGWTTGGQALPGGAGSAPAVVHIDKTTKGLSEALKMMVEGEKRRLWIPGPLMVHAGEQASAIGVAAAVFDVELVSIVRRPVVPPDVASPPSNAIRTGSGLAYRVLRPASSGKRPSAKDRVEVEYAGWTTDGKLFDSSVMRGQKRTFLLAQVIPGWTEGLQLMSVGEKARFWIPPKLAYGDRGHPAGTLVFDIELVAIRN